MKVLRFFDDIDADELEALSAAIDSAEEGEEILIELANGGGSAFHGIAMADRMQHAREEKAIKFICNIWGFAFSAASLVALSCDIVNMSRNAALMYHSAWGAPSHHDEGIEAANRAQLNILSRRISGIKADDFDGEDHWIDAETALDNKIIDSIIGRESKEGSFRIAAKAIFGGEKMEEEKKDQVQTDENKEVKADEISQVDLLEKIVERLDAIEHRVGVLEGEGKKDNDELEASCDDDSQKRLNALYAKLLKPYAKVPKTGAKAEAKKAQDELNDFNKRINISDYIR
jgi:ATP-dependent protease ClpP protease subunit